MSCYRTTRVKYFIAESMGTPTHRTLIRSLITYFNFIITHHRYLTSSFYHTSSYISRQGHRWNIEDTHYIKVFIRFHTFYRFGICRRNRRYHNRWILKLVRLNRIRYTALYYCLRRYLKAYFIAMGKVVIGKCINSIGSTCSSKRTRRIIRAIPFYSYIRTQIGNCKLCRLPHTIEPFGSLYCRSTHIGNSNLTFFS